MLAPKSYWDASRFPQSSISDKTFTGIHRLSACPLFGAAATLRMVLRGRRSRKLGMVSTHNPGGVAHVFMFCFCSNPGGGHEREELG